uniref:Uncharacterized protein n=1 Tax=Arundo donax TaxID=35708 RepID=A0A0A9ANI5_ARUDO
MWRRLGFGLIRMVGGGGGGAAEAHVAHGVLLEASRWFWTFFIRELASV